MGLFPQSFLDDVRLRADLVQVIQDYVPLKRAGGSYKGLCPFHAEKTPSFHVHPEKGFFHCFGCGAGGDVFKFLELHEKLSFQEAVRHLAQRAGLTLPETRDEGGADAAEREALLKVHEAAAAFFRAALAGGAGRTARQLLRDRGVTDETVRALGLGFAPATREGLKTALVAEGFSVPLLVRSGLLVERDPGQIVDRFRSRVMIPICRDAGSIVAFGGRATEADQVPKYLNSPETPIYSKGRMLYGLHLTKAALRRAGYAILVEGYFDFAQVWQAGALPVVASCGTALTTAQAQLLRRFVSKVVLSFDRDAAGQGAAARTGELLLSEGFTVNVALLPPGDDPDSVIRRSGAEAYRAQLRASRPYLDYIMEQAAEDHDLARDDSRRAFLARMLGVAALLPDPAARDQFADRVAHKARIAEDVVRAEIRKAAVGRRTTLATPDLPALGGVRTAEKGLLWAVFHDTTEAVAALAELEDDDLEGLATERVLALARTLPDQPPDALPSALLERLTREEAQLVTGIAADARPPAPAVECVRTLRRLRYDRERADLQREIGRLQDLGAAQHDREIDALWVRKKELLHRIEGLM